MTLDQRIQKDLKGLYNNGQLNGVIPDADKLNKAHVIKDQLSTQELPGHFTGKRDADTVFVTLNPGAEAKKANEAKESLKCEIDKFQIKTNSFNDFILTYKEGHEKYGLYDCGRPDSFDMKQALFLAPWENSGIKFSEGFPPQNIKTTSQEALEAKKKVLMEKLQLELIPYRSKNFKIKKKENKYLLYPFIKTIFNEIFSKKRSYVIFTSRIFEELFSDTSEMEKIDASVKFGEEITPEKPFTKIDGSASKTHFRCKKIVIKYKMNGIAEEQEALIAPTYAVQFGGTIFYQYGQFCYDTYRGNIKKLV